ncbi:MAG: NUDIX domain-containing protein [Opitutales bacterium]
MSYSSNAHPTEILDVVDAENRVIGQAPRQEIHDKNWLHRAVHLFIVDEQSRILLQKRSAQRPTFPRCWESSVSGHLAVGETYDAALFREAKEEIGFVCRDPVPLLNIEGSDLTGYEWIQLYAEKFSGKGVFRPDPNEIDELRWWSRDELLRALLDQPDSFAHPFRTLYFLWRETGFVLPEKEFNDWYCIESGPPDRLNILRSFLESTGFPVRIANDSQWLGVGGQGFFGKKSPLDSDLCVPRHVLAESIALLYLSEQEE